MASNPLRKKEREKLKNPLKEKVKSGEVVVGTYVGLGHPDVAEWLARVGFEWLLLDTEHSPTSYETLQKMMQAMNGTACIPVVRPQWNDHVEIKRVLDIGAYGVVVPMVNSKEEAENAVKACKYPPEGIRGFAPRRAGMFDPDYFKTANQELLVAVQIETKKAIENVDAILSVTGVDACYIGPYDLSCTLGFGVPLNWGNPEFSGAVNRILKAAQNRGKAPGMYVDVNNIDRALESGFKFITVGQADDFLIQAAQAALAKTRQVVSRIPHRG